VTIDRPTLQGLHTIVVLWDPVGVFQWHRGSEDEIGSLGERESQSWKHTN